MDRVGWGVCEMTRAAEAVGWIVAVFAALGVALGLAGYVSVSFGYEVFVVGAQGETAQRFGPLFLAVVFFQTVSVVFFVGVVTALAVGLSFGSRFHDWTVAVAVAGVGGIVGFYLMAMLAFGLTSVGMPTARGFGLGDLLVPLILAGVPSGLVGAVGGYLGWAT